MRFDSVFWVFHGKIWEIHAEKSLYGKLLWSDFGISDLLMRECRFYSKKKAQVIMLGLFCEMTLERINLEYGVPTGILTPVTAVKGRCPRPLDDRDSTEVMF